MPVPVELKPFFNGLVDKSRRSEINWEEGGRLYDYRVRFPDFVIGIAEDERTSAVSVELLNDRGERTTSIKVTKDDEEWIGAVSLINSANLKTRKVGETLRRAMEELEKEGAIGIGSEG